MFEHDWDYFDELVQAFSLGAARSAGLDEYRVRTKLSAMFAEAMEQRLTFDDMTALLDTESASRDQVSRKIAWSVQHSMSAKVWAVNSQLLTTRGAQLRSPLIEQLRRLGFVASKSLDHTPIFDLMRKSPFGHQRTLDAVAVTKDMRRVFLVKGCTYSVAAKSSVLPTVYRGDNLFAPSDRLLGGMGVSSAALRTLVYAWGLCKRAFPDLDCVPVYYIIDDVDAGWHFQAHEIAAPYLKQFESEVTELDRFPVMTSSLQFADRLRDDPNWVAEMPSGLLGAPLYHMPPDRPARALMALDVVQRGQAASASELVPIRATDIGREVETKFDIYYPVDMRRHDLEDCLRGKQLIAKLRDPKNSYTATPVGLARYFLAIAKSGRDLSPDFPQYALSRIHHHSELVWKHRDL